jgi:hypothetical protein
MTMPRTSRTDRTEPAKPEPARPTRVTELRRLKLRGDPPLPDQAHDAGIVTHGAIIVFNQHDQRIASFIPGTLWLGSLTLPDDYSLYALPNTKLRSYDEVDSLEIVHAAQHLALWQTISGSGGYSRFKDLRTNIFTVLDALGGTYMGFQQELAHVCGASRERILRKLADLVRTGELERIRHGSRGDTLILPAFQRGQHWQHTPVTTRNSKAFTGSISRGNPTVPRAQPLQVRQ